MDNILAGEWVVVFGGAGREGVISALLNAGERLSAVVVPALRSENLEDSVATIRSLGVQIIEVGKKDVSHILSQFAGAPLLSIGFPYLLVKDVLSRHPISLNIHPTLLPKYRGPTTGFYVIANSETTTGSTVHVLDEGMDTGPVVAQSRVTLSKFDTVRSMQRKVYEKEPALILEAISFLKQGNAPRPQKAHLATIYPNKRTPFDSEVDPSRSLIELFDTIRASDPKNYPAYFYVEGQKICIRLWRPDRDASEQADTL